jgi:hypothetical protein
MNVNRRLKPTERSFSLNLNRHPAFPSKEISELASTSTEPMEKTEVLPQKTPVEQPKRGRGRPPNPRVATEDEPERQPFFAWIKSFPPTEWQELLYMYLYRCEPFTDRKQTGNHNYIRKYSEPIEEEDVKVQFGSGRYKLMLIRFNPQTEKYERVETHYFSIMDAAFPPKIPLGEWVDDDRNKDWAWCRPQLEAEAAKAKTNAPVGAGGMPDVAVFNAVWDRMEKIPGFLGKGRDELSAMAQLVVQTVQGQLKANGESQNNMLAVVDRIIGSLKPGDGPNTLMTLVTGQLTALQAELAEERKFNRELLTKIGEPKQQRSLKDELADMATIKEIGRNLFGRGGGESSGGATMADVVRDIGGKVIDTGGNILDAYFRWKAAGSPPRQRPTTINANPQLTAPSATQPAGAHADTKPKTKEEEQVEQMQRINQEFGWMFDRLAPELVNIFLDDAPGMVFRDWFIDEYGKFIYNQVKNFSPETILTLIEIRKQQAELSVKERLQQLRPPEKVTQFVQEFLSDAEAPEEDDTPDKKAQGVGQEF